VRRDRCGVPPIQTGADSGCNGRVELDDKLKKVEARIEGLQRFLMEECPQCFTEQKHIRGRSPERTYWHYGYLIALRDVLRLIDNLKPRSEDNGNLCPLDMPDESRYRVD